MRLVLDHHYPAVIATALRARGLDAATLLDRDWHHLDDEALLLHCADAGLVLVTNNVADFAVIARRWQMEGRAHAGLVFTSDARRPRTRAASGAMVEALAELMIAESAPWPDRVHWL